MKWVTFAVAFLLTPALVIGGVALYPEILGKAATANNDFVFELFLGPFFVVLFFADGRNQKGNARRQALQSIFCQWPFHFHATSAYRRAGDF